MRAFQKTVGLQRRRRGSLMGLPVCDQLEAYYIVHAVPLLNIALNRHGLADQRVQIAFVYFKSIFFSELWERGTDSGTVWDV
jgi:hypothetical protein